MAYTPQATPLDVDSTLLVPASTSFFDPQAAPSNVDSTNVTCNFAQVI